MITQEAFPVEPWVVRETRLDLNMIAQSESLFALSNGHIGLRGNLDEGEPYGLPGTYLNSFYEIRPLPYAEAGYGYPEAGQTVVDVTNGKIIRLFVEDEPFDVRYGKLISHERVLDLRTGLLVRNAHWISPSGKQVKISSTRLVSLTHRSIAAIEYVVEAVDEFVRVNVQSLSLIHISAPRRAVTRSAALAVIVTEGSPEAPARRHCVTVNSKRRPSISTRQVVSKPAALALSKPSRIPARNPFSGDTGPLSIGSSRPRPNRAMLCRMGRIRCQPTSLSV